MRWDWAKGSRGESKAELRFAAGSVINSTIRIITIDLLLYVLAKGQIGVKRTKNNGYRRIKILALCCGYNLNLSISVY
jgi:hypothetical protein